MDKKMISITIDYDVFFLINELRERRTLSGIVNDFLRNYVKDDSINTEELELLQSEKKALASKLNAVATKLTIIESMKEKDHQKKLNEVRNQAESFRRAGGMARVLRENALRENSR